MKNKSFTLIELLVVISVIGLLSSIVLVSTKGIREKARIAKTLEFSQSLQNALGSEAVGIWTFDDCTAKDSSGYGNNGAISGAVCNSNTPQAVLNQGNGKNALSFSGSATVNVGSSDILKINGRSTYEAWVKTSQITGLMHIYADSSGQALNRNIEFSVLNGVIRVVLANGTNAATYSSDKNIADGNWNHVVFTANYPNYSFYVNGSQVKTGVMTFDVVSPAGSGARCISGLCWAEFFNGLIDEVRVYKQSLTFSQIRERHAQGLKNLAIE